MANDYTPVTADHRLRHDVCDIARLAKREDLGLFPQYGVDWTTRLLVDDDAIAECHIVARVAGVASGLIAIPWVVEVFEAGLEVDCRVAEGQPFQVGDALVVLRGNARSMLTTERTILNLVSRMCGIATAAARYVEATAGTNADVYDTRKTTPGYRRIEKYAVACGGAKNHRTGLFDGILIKDNHIALASRDDGSPMTLVEGVRHAVDHRGRTVADPDDTVDAEPRVAPEIVEVEVDDLEQFRQILPVGPDIILLDNFTLADLRRAVRIRDAASSPVQLEASGNVRIDTIGAIAATGVDRISSGALTHQATSLDLGLDWVASGRAGAN